MSRFAILEHDHPFLHWDFMLQVGDVLKTWRLQKNPLNHTNVQTATPLEDHRLFYLDYEGPVSGNRGNVKQIDSGTYCVVGRTNDVWKIELEGQRLRRVVKLEQREEERWEFEIQEVRGEPDDFVED